MNLSKLLIQILDFKSTFTLHCYDALLTDFYKRALRFIENFRKNGRTVSNHFLGTGTNYEDLLKKMSKTWMHCLKSGEHGLSFLFELPNFHCFNQALEEIKKLQSFDYIMETIHSIVLNLHSKVKSTV